jgi:hypothetical protein
MNYSGINKNIIYIVIMSIKEAKKELIQEEPIDFKLSDLEPNLESF